MIESFQQIMEVVRRVALEYLTAHPEEIQQLEMLGKPSPQAVADMVAELKVRRLSQQISEIGINEL